jgi:hypothetical protein
MFMRTRFVLVALLLTIFCLKSSGQIVNLPYFNDFKTNSIGWTTDTIGGNILWIRNSNNNVFINSTTPIYGYNDFESFKVLLYSTNTSDSVLHLTSPTFDITGISSIKLDFWYLISLSLVDKSYATLEHSFDGGVTWNLTENTLDPFSTNWYNTLNNDNYQPCWSKLNQSYENAKLTLFNLNSSTITFRLTINMQPFFPGGIYRGMALDNFSITPNYITDIGIYSIIKEGIIEFENSPDTIKFVAVNSGSQTISQFNASYKINIGTSINETFNVNLASGQTDTLAFSTLLNIPSGNNTLTVLVSDSNPTNDSINIEIIGFSTIATPYFDNFENGDLGWGSRDSSYNELSKWKLGTPNFGYTTGAASGSKCWDIMLDTSYANSANSFLYTPFFDMTNTAYPQLTFKLKYFIEASWDGVRIDYLDSLGNWKVLGYKGDPNAYNWYNDSSLNASNLPAWQGKSNNWVTAYYNLASIHDFNSTPQFRFVFNSDPTVVNDGFSLDDFLISDPGPIDAMAIDLLPNISILQANKPGQTLEFKFCNIGITPVSNATIKFKVDNGTIITVPYTGSLNFLDTLTVSNSTFTFSPGYHTVKAWITCTGDGNRFNDSIVRIYNAIPVYNLNYSNDFENFTDDWTSLSDQQPFITDWQQGSPNYGATNSTHSGVFCWDINLTTSYTENATSYLYTPFFNYTLSRNPTLSFWQNRNILPCDKFYIEYDLENSNNWTRLSQVNASSFTNWYDSNCNPIAESWDSTSGGWIQSSITNGFSGNNSGVVQFRFVFSSLDSISDGVSIDDFSLTQDLYKDVSVDSIINPPISIIAGQLYNVEAVIKNNGIFPQSSIPLRYKLNNNAIVGSIWLGTLLQDSSTNVTFGQITPSIGLNTLTVYTNLVGDENRNNDTVVYFLYGTLLKQTPITESFDISSAGWNVYRSSNLSTTWQLGTPGYGVTSSTHSGVNSWDINLYLPYYEDANTVLSSPKFDLTSALTAQLSFWVNYKTELNHDGVSIEYSTDGNIWNLLGTINDPLGTNWYNSTLISSSALGWSGSSNGWKLISYDLTSLLNTPNIEFRFVFTSDMLTNGIGFSIDDFTISTTVGLNENISNTEWKIYPNPASNFIYISKLDESTNFSIKLYTILGEEVYSKVSDKLHRGEVLALPLNNLSTGMYSIQIIEDKSVHKFTFLKQ